MGVIPSYISGMIDILRHLLTPWAFAFGLLMTTLSAAHADWRTASRESVGIAPDPAIVRETVVQVYAARAYSWRGYFAVHTWISTKPANADQFTTYEVVGWRVRRGGNAVVASNRPADGRWFGAAPEILLDLRGQEAAQAIPEIERAISAYPYNDKYTIWPGPNSNTFVAHVARQVTGLRLDLPPTAIGKDYLPDSIVAKTPSGTGAQVSLGGLLGVMVGLEEGVELNILGLTVGIDPNDFALKLPFIGKVGP